MGEWAQTLASLMRDDILNTASGRPGVDAESRRNLSTGLPTPESRIPKMNRRLLISAVIGAMATFSGFTAVVWLRQGRCRDAGGAWDAAAHLCNGPVGRLAIEQKTDIATGVIVALVLAFMLFRISTFASRNRANR